MIVYIGERSSGEASEQLFAVLREADAKQVWRVRRGDVARGRGDDREPFAQRERGELPVGRVSRIDSVGWTPGSEPAQPGGHACFVDHVRASQLESTSAASILVSTR